jgi:hypothetical protein
MAKSRLPIATVLTVLICLSGVQAASFTVAQARKEQGAYLGCFRATAVKLDWNNAAKLGQWSASKCTSFCRYLSKPIYALSRTYACACTADVPNASSRVNETLCASASNGNTANQYLPLFYINAGREGFRHSISCWHCVHSLYRMHAAYLGKKQVGSLTLKTCKKLNHSSAVIIVRGEESCFYASE